MQPLLEERSRPSLPLRSEESQQKRHSLRRGLIKVSHTIATQLRGNENFPSDSGVLFSVSKKRALESPEEESYFDENGYQDGENDEADEADALNALGYMPHTHYVLLGKTNKGTADADDEPVQSKELQTAIMSMPAKPYIGMPLTLRYFRCARDCA